MRRPRASTMRRLAGIRAPMPPASETERVRRQLATLTSDDMRRDFQRLTGFETETGGSPIPVLEALAARANAIGRADLAAGFLELTWRVRQREQQTTRKDPP